MIILDGVVVNVALPSIRGELGGGLTGLQWVVDGYTLTFAALLLSAAAAVLLDAVPADRAGVASGVFNTSGSLAAPWPSRCSAACSRRSTKPTRPSTPATATPTQTHDRRRRPGDYIAAHPRCLTP